MLQRRRACVALCAAAAASGCALFTPRPASAHAGSDSVPLRSDIRLCNGQRLSFLQWGQSGEAGSRPLLMLHGRYSSAAEMAAMAAALAADAGDQRWVVAVDLRGCGFSDWAGDGDYSVEAAVDDLVQLLDAMAWPQVDIYGHSYGAVVGIALAAALDAAGPGRVRALVLEDGGPTLRADGSEPQLNPGQTSRAGAPAAAPAQLQFDSWEQAAAAGGSHGGSTAVPPWLLEARVVRRSDGKVRSRMDLLGLWRSRRGEAFERPWPLVRALRMPVLLLRADRGLVPEDIARDMVSVNPRIRYQTIDNSGHGIHRQHPEQVLQRTRAFLQQATAHR